MRIHVLMLMTSCALFAQDDIVFKAMKDELSRSMSKLRLEQLEKPYFISYRVQDTKSARVSASFGSLISRNEGRNRFLTVEVRVGDYAFDNTNFLAPPNFGEMGASRFGGTLQLPLDDDYDEIRRQLWLATDGVYKKALEDLSRKRAALQNKSRPEEIADFSKEEIGNISDPHPAGTVDLNSAEKLVRDLSAIFRQASGAFNSSARIQVTESHTRFVDSEGHSFSRVAPLVSLVVSASSQAKDGMPLDDSYSAFGHTLGDLGEPAGISARVKEMAARFEAMRNAPAVERYNGPVLFEGQAAAELLGQAFAPRLLGLPRQVGSGPQFESMAAAMAEDTLLDKMGARVLPAFLSLSDNPLIDSLEGNRLFGARKVDDDGIPARETLLVERGILKTLLMARAPVRGIDHSSGSRRGDGPAPTNLIVTTDKGTSLAELKTELVKLAKDRGKDYGILIRRLRNGQLAQGPLGMAGGPGRDGIRVEPATLAYKVYADGREELIRNVMFSGLSIGSFKDIVGTSKERTVYTAPIALRSANPYSFSRFAAGPLLVSIATPSLLFEDLTLQPPQGEIPKPPVSGHPYFEKL